MQKYMNIKIAQYGLLSTLIYVNKPTLLVLPSPCNRACVRASACCIGPRGNVNVKMMNKA